MPECCGYRYESYLLTSDSRRSARPSQDSPGWAQCAETSDHSGPSVTERVKSLAYNVGTDVVGEGRQIDVKGYAHTSKQVHSIRRGRVMHPVTASYKTCLDTTLLAYVGSWNWILLSEGLVSNPDLVMFSFEQMLFPVLQRPFTWRTGLHDKRKDTPGNMKISDVCSLDTP